MKFSGDLLRYWEDIFSVLLATSPDHACMVQPSPFLVVCLSGCLFVISLPKGVLVS